MPLSSDRMSRYIPAIQLFAARLVLFHQKVAERLGLTATEFKALRLLELLGPLTLTQLAEEAGLGLGTMSGLVDKFVAEGLVLREKDQADRRRTLLSITQRGTGEAGQFYQDQSAAMASLLEGYEDSDFETIMAFLTQTSETLALSTKTLD